MNLFMWAVVIFLVIHYQKGDCAQAQGCVAPDLGIKYETGWSASGQSHKNVDMQRSVENHLCFIIETQHDRGAAALCKVYPNTTTGTWWYEQDADDGDGSCGFGCVSWQK